MTHPDLPDLPPDVAALLADARGTPGAPATVRSTAAPSTLCGYRW